MLNVRLWCRAGAAFSNDGFTSGGASYCPRAASHLQRERRAPRPRRPLHARHAEAARSPTWSARASSLRPPAREPSRRRAYLPCEVDLVVTAPVVEARRRTGRRRLSADRGAPRRLPPASGAGRRRRDPPRPSRYRGSHRLPTAPVESDDEGILTAGDPERQPACRGSRAGPAGPAGGSSEQPSLSREQARDPSRLHRHRRRRREDDIAGARGDLAIGLDAHRVARRGRRRGARTRRPSPRPSAHRPRGRTSARNARRWAAGDAAEPVEVDLGQVREQLEQRDARIVRVVIGPARRQPGQAAPARPPPATRRCARRQAAGSTASAGLPAQGQPDLVIAGRHQHLGLAEDLVAVDGPVDVARSTSRAKSTPGVPSMSAAICESGTPWPTCQPRPSRPPRSGWRNSSSRVAERCPRWSGLLAACEARSRRRRSPAGTGDRSPGCAARGSRARAPPDSARTRAITSSSGCGWRSALCGTITTVTQPRWPVPADRSPAGSGRARRRATPRRPATRSRRGRGRGPGAAGAARRAAASSPAARRRCRRGPGAGS